MGNLGGMEVIVILLVALVVLGPKKLPEAARQVGRALTEVKRISNGFQREMREAMEDPIAEAEARAKGARVTAPGSPATPADAGSAEETPTERDTETETSDTSTEAEPAGGESDTQASTS